MPDTEGKQAGGSGQERDRGGGTQPSDKGPETPGTPHKGGFGEQEADARPDDVPSAEDVPGR